MNYTREIVSTARGEMRVMTAEMRELMKAGIKRRLVPLKEFKGSRLKLDKESKSEISSLNKEIKQIQRNIDKLEYKKSQLGVDESEIFDINRRIELYEFDMFEKQNKIRDIKKACYKNQTSTIDLDA